MKREIIMRIEDLRDGGDEGYIVVTNTRSMTFQISMEQDCCEQAGYFWCNDNPQDFVGAAVYKVTLTDTALNTKMLEDNGAAERDAGGIVFVNVETSKGTLQFVAYNCQNGYYGHGVKIKTGNIDEETIV